MPDRTINWGDPSDPGTTYQTGDDDPAGGGNFVVARDTDGGVTLLEYDPAAGEWVSRGDVNLDGNDLSANAIDANAVSAETLEATSSITDAEGNTVTSLSDPVRVTEDTVTFTESGVSLVLNKITVSDDSLEISTEKSVVDNFESGDLVVENADWNDWSGETANFSAQQTTTLLGSWSGELTVADTIAVVQSTRSSVYTPNTTIFDIYIDNQSGNSNDEIIAGFKGFGGGAEVIFLGNGDILTSDNVKFGEWSEKTHYRVTCSNIDFINDVYDVEVVNFDTNNTVAQENGASFNLSEEDFEEFALSANSGASSQTTNIVIDGVVASTTEQTSGDALVIFDSGTPDDIESWDLATFQRTLDGETVTIDVEDSTGTVLKSDISRNEDISDIATSTDVQLRATLSRNDTANNPTLDYAARRFTR